MLFYWLFNDWMSRVGTSWALKNGQTSGECAGSIPRVDLCEHAARIMSAKYHGVVRIASENASLHSHRVAIAWGSAGGMNARRARTHRHVRTYARTHTYSPLFVKTVCCVCQLVGRCRVTSRQSSRHAMSRTSLPPILHSQPFVPTRRSLLGEMLPVCRHLVTYHATLSRHLVFWFLVSMATNLITNYTWTDVA